MTKIPQRLLGEALLNSAETNPSKTAIIAKGREYSYAELNNGASKLAAHISSTGIEKGSRVVLYMNNSWQCAVSIYSVTLAGMVFIVVNPQTKADKLNYILNNSGAKIVLSENRLRFELEKALKNANSVQELIITGDAKEIITTVKQSNFEAILEGENLDTEHHSVISNDLAALIYT
ncbi:MAG: AMP-binding protein, partial [Mariniphaga sp.]|nr:AMP-binding protein [Mariniphaga sp.]